MKTIILILIAILIISCQSTTVCCCKDKSHYQGTEYKKEQKNEFEN